MPSVQIDVRHADPVHKQYANLTRKWSALKCGGKAVAALQSRIAPELRQ
jgi:hypothetical protein